MLWEEFKYITSRNQHSSCTYTCVCVCMCSWELRPGGTQCSLRRQFILGSDMALITTKSSQCVVLEKRIREIYILWILGLYECLDKQRAHQKQYYLLFSSNIRIKGMWCNWCLSKKRVNGENSGLKCAQDTVQKALFSSGDYFNQFFSPYLEEYKDLLSLQYPCHKIVIKLLK